MFTVNKKDTGAVDKKRTNKQTKKFIETSPFDIVLGDVLPCWKDLYFLLFSWTKNILQQIDKKTDIMFHLFAQVVAFWSFNLKSRLFSGKIAATVSSFKIQFKKKDPYFYHRYLFFLLNMAFSLCSPARSFPMIFINNE